MSVFLDDNKQEHNGMNIKQVISSQSIRHRLLRLSAWLPDRYMLALQYYMILKRWPELKIPKRFTEKIQYYKMHYRNNEMFRCVDKYEVRNYVTQKLRSDLLLNDLYQVCDTPEQIIFDKLPDKFVIKTTDGGGGDNVFICKDKSTLQVDAVIRKINKWRKKKYYIVSREWAYRGAKKSQIIVEKYLENSEHILDDYKFLCYNGKFRYLWVDKDRYTNHRRGFWNENLEFLKDVRTNYPILDTEPSLPSNIQEMIKIAETLSADFPFARIDLYNVEGVIYFGEITFYPWSGYVRCEPDSFDFELGKYFDVNFN